MFIEHHARTQPSRRMYYGTPQEYLNGSKGEALGRNFSFSRKRPVLCYIAQSGNASLFSCLLDLGHWPPNEKDDQARTALTLAAGNGHTDTVQLLLDSHADIESRDTDGRTLLSAADDYHADSDGPNRLYSSYPAGITEKEKVGREPMTE